MSKERKHLTPPEWEEEDSGQVSHPHREVKIVGEKKIGLEHMDEELTDKEDKKTSADDSGNRKTL
jgi:hypothetical protein